MVMLEEASYSQHPAFERPSLNTCLFTFYETEKLQGPPRPLGHTLRTTSGDKEALCQFHVHLSKPRTPTGCDFFPSPKWHLSCLFFNETSLHIVAQCPGNTSDMPKFILFPWRHFPSLLMAYKLWRPRGKMSVHCSLSVQRSNTVRNWTEMNLRRAELNSKKPNKSQGVDTQDPRAVLWVLVS